MRSTGFQRPTAMAGMTTVVSARTSAVTVGRPVETTDSLDAVDTTVSDHTERLWLFAPDERSVDESVGERITGSLGALAVSDGTVDLQPNDRVTYGGVEYEIDTVVGHPEDDQADGTASPATDVWLASFERRE
jgi:hypothetical protein